MTESSFSKIVRLGLSARYKGLGCWWPNSTGYGASHHNPFGGRGAGDLIGCLGGRWVEIELKTKTGKWGDEQRVRCELVMRLGGVYVKANELGALYAALDEIAYEETVGNWDGPSSTVDSQPQSSTEQKPRGQRRAGSSDPVTADKPIRFR